MFGECGASRWPLPNKSWRAVMHRLSTVYEEATEDSARKATWRVDKTETFIILARRERKGKAQRKARALQNGLSITTLLAITRLNKFILIVDVQQ